jgi:hypothetical protein
MIARGPRDRHIAPHRTSDASASHIGPRDDGAARQQLFRLQHKAADARERLQAMQLQFEVGEAQHAAAREQHSKEVALLEAKVHAAEEGQRRAQQQQTAAEAMVRQQNGAPPQSAWEERFHAEHAQRLAAEEALLAVSVGRDEADLQGRLDEALQRAAEVTEELGPPLATPAHHPHAERDRRVHPCRRRRCGRVTD